MPRYYFNTRIGDELISDPDGEVLVDPDRAWEMARAMIRELLKTDGAEGVSVRGSNPRRARRSDYTALTAAPKRLSVMGATRRRYVFRLRYGMQIWRVPAVKPPASGHIGPA